MPSHLTGLGHFIQFSACALHCKSVLRANAHMMKYFVTLHGAPAHNSEAVSLISFTMDAQGPGDLLEMIHAKYVNIVSLKFMEDSDGDRDR